MSTDNKPTVQQAAKQGNPQAIAILLNRQLQPKGITAKVSVKNSCLQIMLEAANVPNQKGLVATIQKWIDDLDVDSIQSVQIYAKQTGEGIPSWNDSFEVVRQLEDPKIADTVISPTVPTETVKNDVKVEEINASKLDPALLELAKNGDIKAISDIQNSSRKDLNSPKINLQTFSVFKNLYFRINPVFKIFVVIISLLLMAYYNSYLGKFKDEIYQQQDSTDRVVKLYRSRINLKSAGNVNVYGLNDRNTMNEAIKEIYENRQKMEISYNYHAKVFNFLLFLLPTIILACMCMEILYLVNLKKDTL